MPISLDDFSRTIAAIHQAAAFPERWPDAVSAVARLVSLSGGRLDRRNPEKLLRFDALGDGGKHPASDSSVAWLMALLAPHLQAARQVQSRLAEILPGRLALASLDRLALAAFIVDGAGAVHHLNAAARTLLNDDRCVRIANSRFRFKEGVLNAALDAALRKATQVPPRSTLLPLRSGERKTYEVAVSPLQGASPDASDMLPLALVAIHWPPPNAERIAQQVRPLYGLTETEARVMAALTLGRTVDEIARAHGVQASTVRAQVRSIFEKTGAHRQADLVRLAMMGAPLFAGPDS